MTIEDFFKQYDFASVIFDPVPSYSGDWFFGLDNLRKNSKVVKDGNGIKHNLFQEFYNREYSEPLKNIFGTERVLDFEVGLVSSANKDNIGRSLKFSKIDFFLELSLYLNQNIDKYGKTSEEHLKYLDSLFAYITRSNEELNNVYQKAIKEKHNKLEEAVKNEFSEYFDALIKDYKRYENTISFSEYLNNSERIAYKFSTGLLKLGDFFDRRIDFNSLYKCFDPDTFYLLFAKIIYEFNLVSEKKKEKLDNNYGYLFHYNSALEEMIKSNADYNPKIFYTLPNGKKIQYSRRNFQQEFKELMNRHPEAKAIRLPASADPNKYKDINLMKKIAMLYSKDTKVNWEFLPSGEGIKRGTNIDTKLVVKEDVAKNELINEVNERIQILENSGFIGTPIRGLNTFNGYYAFIYANGKVILEKFWRDEENQNPARFEATYVMNIDNFIDMSRISKLNLIEYMRTLPNSGLKRIFHTSLDRWRMDIKKEINGTYRLEDAIDFISKLQSGGLTNGE